MNLYQIEESISSVLDKIPETGELTPDVEQELDKLEQQKEVKLVNTGLYIKNLEAFVNAVKEEENSLKEKRLAVENKVRWLKKYLSDFGETVNLPNIKISFVKSERVETDDNYNAENLHKSFPDIVKKEILYKLDKTLAKKKIKAGENITGLRIEKHQNIQVK